MVTRAMQLSGFRSEVAAETIPNMRSWLCPLAFILLVAGDLLCLGNSGAWIAGPATVACGAAALILAEKCREPKGGTARTQLKNGPWQRRTMHNS
jgi:hypothetical protein